MDPRKDYIARCALDAIGAGGTASAGRRWARPAAELMSSLLSCRQLEDFIESPSVALLQVSVVASGGQHDIVVSNTVGVQADCEGGMVFTKRSSEQLTAESIASSVLMTTFQSSPLQALQLMIKQLYAPLLLQDPHWASQLDATTQQTLEKLNTSLSSDVQRGGGAVSEDDVSGIISLYDECQHWRILSSGGMSHGADVRRRAETFWQTLSPVADRLRSFGQLPIGELSELLDSLHDILDTLYHAGFKEARMVHFFRLIGGAIDGYVQKMLGSLDLWRDSYRKVSKSIRDAQDICASWTLTTAKLTTQYWGSSWKSGPFTDEVLARLQARLSEVLAFRSVHHQLLGLLSPQEVKERQVEQVFTPFDGVNPMHHSQFTQPAWAAATAQFEAAMRPIEQLVARTISSRFASSGLKAHALLREYLRYKELIRRPIVFAELAPGREMLLGQLEQQLEVLREDFESRTGSTNRSKQSIGRNLPEVVTQIILAQQLQEKATEMLTAADTLLHDLQGMSRFRAKTKELHQYLSDYKEQLFSDWVESVEKGLQDEKSGLAMQLSGRLMEVNKEGDLSLQVNYSDRLVRFLREVRQLSALGFKMPQAVQWNADMAHKFYRHGVVLKQVANFYNTIGTQIVRSQKPLLLDYALKFEKLATNPSAKSTSDKGSNGKMITWSDPNQLEVYVQELHQAAEQLTQENRKLRQVHFSIGEQVCLLMDVSLLKQQSRWKERVDDIREKIDKLQDNYSGMKGWRVHWDMQLFKALEHQYQVGLEGLHLELPQKTCDLEYKNRTVQLKPPLEQLRALFYRDIKKFIGIPTSFKGIGYYEEGQKKHKVLKIFRDMPDRNVASLHVVYNKACDLFSKLEALIARYRPYMQIGMHLGSIDDLIEEKFSESAQFDASFKALKARRKEAEKLPSYERVDCITVSLAPFKAALDAQLQHLSDALLIGMRRVASAQSKDISQFIQESLEALSKRPQSMEEIGEAKHSCQRIMGEKEKIRAKFRKLEELNKMIKGVNKQSAVDLAQLTSRWDELDENCEAFNDRVEDQMQHLRGKMGERISDLQLRLEKFSSRWFELKPKKLDTGKPAEMQQVIASVKDWEGQFVELEGNVEHLLRDCGYFSIAVPSFAGLEDLRADIKAYVSSCSFFEEYTTELRKLAEEDWISFRQRLWVFDDFVTAWFEKSAQCPPGAVAEHLRSELARFREMAPVLRHVRGDVFQPEHWRSLLNKLKLEKMSIDKLCLSHFLESSKALVDHAEEFKVLAARAVGEVAIREAIQEVNVWSQETSFTLTEHDENGRQTPLIKDWKDLTTSVSDLQSLLSSLKDSPFFGAFADTVTQYESKLTLLDSVLAQLNPIQRKWVYLEPIFGRGAMPHEQGRFKRVDEEFRSIMLGIGENPLVFSLLRVPQLSETLSAILDQLERCQKALSDFLEDKRQRFPRFYFIGDDDLLEILGQAKNPTVIQSHLKKLFAGIHKVQFSENNSSITAMCSLDGEVVPLQKAVPVTDSVESWLQLLNTMMRSTLTAATNHVLESGKLDIGDTPSQVLCLAEIVSFTRDAEAALQSGRQGVSVLKAELMRRLQEYTSYGTEDKLLQLKVKALVLDLIHNMDVCDQLNDAHTTNVNDWQWRKQLRYYADKGAVVMRMVASQFDYTYEYQGNTPKLVHTPLTDKCYLTLTQAMFMGYGGNPYGPAGTGKTESVKALGAAFGRQVLVFNCDEGIDSKSMCRIFIGLVKCGAWGCFDEFNRLLPDQLSEISQQIQIIQAAIKGRQPSVDLLGTTTQVDFNAGIFITMNPAGKGYGGRSKLPDNLKALFRAVAMSKPDNELIAEVMMYSEGFTHAKALAAKLVAVFQLSKQLLSPQQHYDWGLRALKTILRVGGQIMADEKRKLQPGESTTLELEEQVLIRSLRINTLSKLTHGDTGAFNALIGDVFPGAKVSDVAYDELEAAVKAVLTEEKLEELPLQLKKIMQFYEATMQRMGVVVVGPSGCGKSTIWRVLQKALQKLGQKIPTYVMNPKSMPREQLLGHMDMDTREWFDGVLTAAARKVVREPMEVKSWIICDGDIDPEWVESLNSVLDDNRLLTMPSGERIQFNYNVNFIFETHDLKFASPATVSRMGMIFLDQESSDIKCIVSCWIRRQPEQLQMKLQQWLDDYFFKALDWVLELDAAVVQTTTAGVVNNALSHLVGVSTKAEFVAAAVHGFGSNMILEKRAELAKLLYSWAKEYPADHRRPLDGYYDKKSGEMKLFQLDDSQLASFEDLMSDEGPMVRTAAVQRDEMMLMPWMTSMEPFILVGPEGCGKNMLLTKLFNAQRSTQVAVVHCSAQTLASHVIHKLSSVCQMSQTQSGRILRPKDAARVVLYLKDINLPKPDKYDTAELVAFLQQLVTYQGFYDKNLDFVGLQNVHVVASMNPSTTVGRYALTTRFTANVRIACVSYPEKEALNSIYSSLLHVVLAKKCAGSAQWDGAAPAKKLAACMIEVFEQVRRKLSVDEQRHYLFTPRDLTQWTKGLLRYELKESAQLLLDMWAFEGARQFRDRLVSVRDAGRFDAMIANALRSHFDYVSESEGKMVFSTLIGGATDRVAASPTQSLTLRRAPITDLEKIVRQGLLMYEREVKELNLVVFPEVLHNIVHIERVLSQPGGHLLLVGSSGVGRRSLLSLVSYMHGVEVFTPNMTRDYSLKTFRAELKQLLPKAGVQGIPCVLLLEDHQLRDEALIECVNSLLSAGELPGLFEQQELDTLLAPLKEEMGNAGFKHRTIFDFFVSRVQTYLHVVLSMDPNNSTFATRCESNPALFTRCKMLWMSAWETDSMERIARATLEKVPSDMLPEKQRAPLTKQMVLLHQKIQARGSEDAAPRKYVSFVNMWQKVFVAARQKLSKRVEHLRGGLDKLVEAGAEVDKLSKKAVEQRALLTTKQQEADKAMEQIQKSMERAVERRTEVEVLQKKLGKEEIEMNERKAQVEEELSHIQPVLEAARQAVGSIKSDNLNEIRMLKMPPEPIRDVMEGVLRVMGNFDTSWISMKRFLGNRSVLTEILNFDSRKITPEIRKSVRELLQSKGQSFEHAVIYRVSVAAAPLAAWVKANMEYSTVLEKVSPLEARNAELQLELDSSQERLDKCKNALDLLDKKVVDLKNDFAKRTAEAESLKVSLQKAEEVLGAAQELLEKLSGERSRWDITMKDLMGASSALPAHSLLSAAFVAYLADEQEKVRAEMLKEWVEQVSSAGLLATTDAGGQAVAGGASFSLLHFLSSEGELLRWKGQGLPTDKLSSENAIVILKSDLTPLIIDPSSQATQWLKTNLQADGGSIEVLVPHDPRFATSLELGVRFGKTIVVQEVDKIEPMLVPLLRRDLLRQGPRWVVQVGDKQIDYNEGFRLFLTTRNPQPDLPADVASLVSVVNFSVTAAGLEEQLLGVTIKHEQPELESKKSTLLAAQDQLKIELEEMEQRLLTELAESEGNILENKKLIDSLNELKASANKINSKLEESSQLQASLDSQRNVFRPIAEVGSALFFTLLDLLRINPMYKYSLPMFLELFDKALNAKELGHAPPEERTRALGPLLQQLVFGSVSRSLFKRDRLTYGMHLIHMLHPQLFGENEWAVFTGQTINLLGASGGMGSSTLPSWAHADRGPAFNALAQALPLLVQLPFSDAQWVQWSQSERCELEFPSSLPSTFTPFQRILLLQALRPDRLIPALINFVTKTLHVTSLSPSSSSLQQIFEQDSSAFRPILMITTAGADPTQELEDYASRVMPNKYKQLAMGGQQTFTALTLVREAAKAGTWLCLKNLHLVVHWVPELEKELSSLAPNPNFRLWLTTEQHPSFPTIILQQSLKVTFEAPPGIQKNLQRTYESLMYREFVERGSPARAQLLFVLSWFHAVLQERRTYIPQGWTKFYEFSPADLRSAADICDSAVGSTQGHPDWVTIHGLLGSAIYGGRVDNVQDERLLNTYLQQYFSSSMVSPNARGARQLAPGVSLPSSSQHSDYLQVISMLQTQDTPSLFGLPANADRAVQQRDVAHVQVNLKALSVEADVAGKFDRERWATQLTPLLTLWQKAGANCEQFRGLAIPPPEPNATPVETIVVMELRKAKLLLRTVDDSLGAIGRVVRGTELLGTLTKEEGTTLANGGIPSSWSAVWEGPDEPEKWMRQAVVRIAALQEWQSRLHSGQLLRSPLNLGELLNPSFFLTALRQQTARNTRTPMDSLRLVCSIESGMLSSAALTFQVQGLLIQGASCAPPQGLSPINSDAPIFAVMPPLHLAWVPSAQPELYPSERSAMLPLYLDQEREIELAQLRLPCSGTEMQWVQAGAALFLTSH